MHCSAVLLVVIVAFVNSGTTSQCYECDPNNPECADPFYPSPNFLINCPDTLSGGHQSGAQANANANSGYTPQGGQGHGSQTPKGKSNALCYKAVVKTHDDLYQVHRGCGGKSEKETCDYVKNTLNLQHGDTLYTCKTCSGEHCNSAPRHLSITLSLLLLAPLMVLINKF